jgi:hypothetical protein
MFNNNGPTDLGLWIIGTPMAALLIWCIYWTWKTQDEYDPRDPGDW